MPTSKPLAPEKITLKELELELPENSPKFIAIDGPIGVGKTTLAKNLAVTLQGDAFLEDPDANPFLERFYKDSRSYALPTQLCFLMQRAKQLEKWRQNDLFSAITIADYIVDKDPVFAEVTLDDDELKLYQMVYKELNIQSPKPDIVIYLQASPEVLLERISKRGIGAEKIIDANYLKALSEAYTEFFYYYFDAPLLIVNASEIDFVSNIEHYRQLVNEILSDNSGKRYYSVHPN